MVELESVTAHVCVWMCAGVCLCMLACVFVYACVCVYACVFVCMCVHPRRGWEFFIVSPLLNVPAAGRNMSVTDQHKRITTSRTTTLRRSYRINLLSHPVTEN